VKRPDYSWIQKLNMYSPEEREAWIRYFEEAYEVDGTTDVNPSHYDFPGGVQVKDISAHLTSFGGQALQYIARSTRLDGMNTGEQVTDLQKAIRLIEWEIERLEGV
jgi:hypothetical protein